VTVLEGLTDALPALTDSVTRLTDQLGQVLKVTAPLAVAEREISRMEQLFGRRRRAEPRLPDDEPGQVPSS
jgi:hypothetical protein